jgi:hypothetical protein
MGVVENVTIINRDALPTIVYGCTLTVLEVARDEEDTEVMPRRNTSSHTRFGSFPPKS